MYKRSEVDEALSAHFDPKEVKFRPGAVSGTRAMAIGYVDCRVVQDRLDAVFGPGNWTDDYEFLPNGSVICRLRVRIGGEWIQKTDVGSQSEQPDEGDRCKAAVSDALKRAAVKLGIGRYLYRLANTWVDYDPQKKQLKSKPTLPAPEKAKAERVTLPEDGIELAKRMQKFEGELVRNGLCQPGELLKYVLSRGCKTWQLPDSFELWTGHAIEFAVHEATAFRNMRRKGAESAAAVG